MHCQQQRGYLGRSPGGRHGGVIRASCSDHWKGRARLWQRPRLATMRTMRTIRAAMMPAATAAMPAAAVTAMPTAAIPVSPEPHTVPHPRLAVPVPVRVCV